jgi:hypothetical protein
MYILNNALYCVLFRENKVLGIQPIHYLELICLNINIKRSLGIYPPECKFTNLNKDQKKIIWNKIKNKLSEKKIEDKDMEKYEIYFRMRYKTLANNIVKFRNEHTQIYEKLIKDIKLDNIYIA